MAVAEPNKGASRPAAQYTARERLRDGRAVEIRALKPDDRTALLAAVGRIGVQSLYRRFFGVKRHFTDQEVDFFVNIDFINHVALVAVVEEGGRPTIAGGARYVVVQPGIAEVAFAVVDQYQGQSIGAALMRHLTTIARQAGLTTFVADVLPSNAPMLKVFENSGLPMRAKRESGTVSVSLQID